MATPTDPRARLAGARTRIDLALTGLFLAALAAPTIDEYVRPPSARSPRDAELRDPAPRPQFYAELGAVRRFAGEYEAYYLDSFGLRDKLLRWGSIERLFVFGVSPTPTIDLGRDRWMFYTENASVPAYRGRLPFQPGELRAWQDMLENRATIAESIGATHLLVIGPNKETIYPEMLPAHWTKVGPSRLEQLDQWLKEHDAKARFLDLRPALLAEKVHDAPGDHLYFELGTHWNGRGVYTAYRTILEALAKHHPGLEPLRPEEFNRTLAEDHGDTWARSMYVDDLVPQANHLFVARSVDSRMRVEAGTRVWTFEGGDPNGPRALMFHDSFGESIMFQLAPHFSRLVCYWTGDVSDAVIEREKPDVLLEVFVERYLVNYIPQDHQLGRGDLSRVVYEKSNRALFVLAPGNVALLEPRGSAHAKPPLDDGLVRFDFDDANGYVAMPRFRLPEKGDLLVRVEFDAERRGDLLVLPVWTGETEPRRKQYASSPFLRGRNVLHLRVPRTEKLDGLALRFRIDGAGVVLRALEVRAMPGV